VQISAYGDDVITARGEAASGATSGMGQWDNRIGAGESGGKGLAYRLRVGADRGPVSRSQNDDCYHSACHTLLVPNSLVACDQGVEAGLLGGVEELAVGQFGPSHLVGGANLVAGKDFA
jgi:hypothetical protein